MHVRARIRYSSRTSSNEKPAKGSACSSKVSTQQRTKLKMDYITSSSESPKLSEKLLEIGLRPFCCLRGSAPGPGEGPRCWLDFRDPGLVSEALELWRGRRFKSYKVSCFFAGFSVDGTLSLGMIA